MGKGESLEQRLCALLGGIVREEGCELVHLELTGAGGASVLRLYIDRPGGVTLDDCERVSHRTGAVLDVEDLVPFRYTLEVSSPGLNRPLVRAEDYVRFQGRRARLRTRSAINGQRNFRGVLEGLHQGMVRLREEEKKETICIPLDDIQKANLLFEFTL